MIKLNSVQMATFAARGFLRFDGIIPDSINRQFVAEAGDITEFVSESPMQALGKLMASNDIPAVAAGTPLESTYPADSALGKLLREPVVAGAFASLVGGGIFDHHALHLTLPASFYAAMKHAPVSQNTHQDSTIDPRRAFDVQLMYFPHAVTRAMGGTRFVPGTHLRKVSEAAIGRYQNVRGQQHVVCPAGTVLFLHHGIWHGGGVNRSDDPRYMFKIRVQPDVRQRKLWNTDDLPDELFEPNPIFYIKERRDPNAIASILMHAEPWFEADTGRLEYINRIKFWRFLLGDEKFDIDYWLTRVEQQPVV